MTLSPVEHDRARGLGKGPDYQVGPRCSNPNCNRISEHAHHIWRRTALGGPFDWVEVDGHAVANKTGLCWDCHNDITGKVGGHRALIEYDGESKLFWWCLGSGEDRAGYHRAGLLEPQPPTPDTLVERASGNPQESELCPTCGQRKERRRPTTAIVGRRRKTWTVKVPADELENGADVLDGLIEGVAPFIPNADTSAIGRYYVLVPSLAYVQLDVQRFLDTMAGVGG